MMCFILKPKNVAEFEDEKEIKREDVEMRVEDTT
jgi:hypothetical protein